MKEPMNIADLPEADRLAYDEWLRDFVCPLTYTEEELDELARFDAMKKHGTPHEL